MNCTDLKRTLDDPMMARTVVLVDTRGPAEVSRLGMHEKGEHPPSRPGEPPPGCHGLPQATQQTAAQSRAACLPLYPPCGGQKLPDSCSHWMATCLGADGGQHDSRQPDAGGV